VNEGITGFYRKLYEFKEVDLEEGFFMTIALNYHTKKRNLMETELSEGDLLMALNTCADSAPGPHGIPFSTCMKLWSTAGSYVLNSWKHSFNTGVLPSSHSDTVITLIPKEGKDTKDIKNWRPITLLNCNSKNITIALTLKMAKALGEQKHPHQTAYISGRSVTDSLSNILFMKDHYKEEGIDAVVISLDARKA
jgi:hypothetical protein